jgi:hypothetical protein
LHTELSTFSDRISLGVDGTFFTNRTSTNVLVPTELDFTAEPIFHAEPFELHLAYERDMPLGAPGLVQQFIYVVAVYSFDLKSALPDAYSHRNTMPSP